MNKNKYDGFMMLKDMKLPSVRWRKFHPDTVLSPDLLWTIRIAVYEGKDNSLPRLVGATDKEAEKFAHQMLRQFEGTGMVICYPYFIAEKSGNLFVFNDSTTIEAVSKDLWNLVDKHGLDVSITYRDGDVQVTGDKDFLSENEQNELLKHVPVIKAAFRDDLFEGKGALLEWSFARNCNAAHEPVGEPYLVFYEARTVGLRSN